MSEEEKIIIFDFDGVIADSFEIAYRISKEFNPQISRDDYRTWFEGNIFESVDKHYGHTSRTANAYFFERQAALIEEIHIFAGMCIVIKDLSAQYHLEIVSSNQEDVIARFLARHALQQFFGTIHGMETHVNKVHKIEAVMQTYKNNQHLFVTDTLGDLIEAKEANIGAVAVSWGFHTHATLAREVSYAIVDTPEALMETIYAYFDPTKQ